MRILRKVIREHEGAGRLGRHVEHDPRSWSFSAGTAAVKTVTHQRHGKAFDQGTSARARATPWPASS